MQVGGLLVATRNCSLNHADKFGAIKEVGNSLDDLYRNVRTLLLDKGNKNNIIREKAILYVNKFHSKKAALDSLNFMYSNKNF